MAATDAPPFALVGDVYHSTVDGLIIAWDMCGQCLLHITVCSCREPVEPTYIGKLRDNGRPLATAVARDIAAPNVGARPRPSRGLSIGDLVDDEVIAKVKAARS